MLTFHATESLSTGTEAMARSIADHFATSMGFLKPLMAIVPNATVRSLVEFELARRQGVVVNLRTLSFSRLLDELLSNPEEPEPTRSSRLRAGLLALLSEPPGQRPELAALHDYVAAGEGPDDQERRRAQLSWRLARIIETYEVTRPEELSRLVADESAVFCDADALEAELEVCQGALCRALVELGAWRPPLEELAAIPVERMPDRLVVFGFSSIPELWRRLLQRLSEKTEIELIMRRPEGVLEEGSPLRAWARPLRETLDALSTLPEVKVAKDTGKASEVGGVLQELVAAKAEGRNPERLAVLSCPSIQREAEIVVQDIWQRVKDSGETDKPLRFDEIAVLIAGSDVDSYRSHLEQACRQTNRLPVSVISRPATAERLVEAALLLLELPLGRMRRDEGLRVLLHPRVQAGLPEPDPEGWQERIGRLALFHGVDREDHDDTHISRDLYSWDQAARRVALGTFFGGGDRDDAALVEQGGEVYPALTVDPGEAASMARLTTALRALVEDVKALRRAELPLTRWSELLVKLLTTWLTAPDRYEGRILGRCIRAVQSIAELDREARPVSYRIAGELARERLSALSMPAGQRLAGGVMLDRLTPHFHAPVRLAYVVGLGEGLFPRPNEADILDLRHSRPKDGDAFRLDRDRQAFFDLLASVQEQLVLSYVGRDAYTNDLLAPSSLIRELAAFVQPSKPKALLEKLTTVHPLRRFDERYRDGELPQFMRAAAAEGRAAKLRARLADHGLRGGLDLLKLERAIDSHERSRLRDFLQVPEPLAPQDPEDHLVCRVTALRALLKSPLQAWGKHKLRLREDEEDLLRRADEPFEPGRLEETGFLTRSFSELATHDPDSPEFERRLRELAIGPELAAELPTGFYLEARLPKLLGSLRGWQRAVRKGLKVEPASLKRIAFRDGQDDRVGEERLPPLELAGAGKSRPLTVLGSTRFLTADDRVSLRLRAKTTPKVIPDHDFVDGFIDLLLLAASGRVDDGRFRVALAFTDGGLVPLEYRVPSREKAAEILGRLAEFLHARHHAELLPIELVVKLREALAKGQSVSWWAENWWPSKAESQYQSNQDRYGPITRREGLGSPPDTESLLSEIWGPFFEWRV